jgi:hypothetical protein
MAVNGSHVWATIHGGSSITELNAGDGALVRVIT